MPRGHRARVVDEPELMDMDEPAAVEQEVAKEEEVVAEPNAVEEEEEECEETITISAADLVALQDTLDDIRFHIANMRRDACQVQLKEDERYKAIQAMLRDIVAWLPQLREPLH